MAYSSNNKKVHDTPLWLPTAQFRTAINSIGSMTIAKDTNDRYIYYMSGSLFYKYDTWKDVHVKLASPMIAGAGLSSIKYSKDEGYRGNCLGATGSTMTIAPMSNDLLTERKILITRGTGVGQEKTILSASDNTIQDWGIITSTVAQVSMTDTTKRWEINQFIGYQVRIVFGTGTSQIRKILYNDANTLYFYDINYQQLEAWNNTVYSITAPFATPVALSTIYYIESGVITVDTPWSPAPDASSSYVIKGGGVWMASSAIANGYISFQYYDVISDTWTIKTPLLGNLLSAFGTDMQLEVMTTEVAYDSGTASSATTRKLVDSTKSLVIDRYCNYEIRITSGTGIGQKNRIVANGTNYYEIERPWVTTPGVGDAYSIYGDTNKIYLSGNGASSLYLYSIEQDIWHTGHFIDYGETRNISAQFNGQEAFGITSITRNTGGITALNSVPTAGGTGYAIGDLFNITTGGTIGKGRVEGITASGVVTAVSLYSSGLNYTTGTGKVTTIISGAGNNGLTVNITSVGTVGRIITPLAVNLYKGDSIVISGCSETAYNATYSVLAIDANTTAAGATFDIVTSATANAVASFAQSTTLVVDSTKNWAINEHVGKIVKIDTAGINGTSQIRRITSNTATTITVATIVAGVNGTSRYVIMMPEAIGIDRQYRLLARSGEGRASSGTTASLVDSSKNWIQNQWLGYKVRIQAGTGVGSEVVISANDPTTLTLTTPGFTPDTTTKYIIMDTFGTVTGNNAGTTLGDTTKNWVVNQWIGKRVRITSGLGISNETTITSNTATVLTFGAITAPDTTSTYSILGVVTRSTGTGLRWAFGSTHADDKGKFLISIRGGNTNTLDYYDISTNIWIPGSVFSPQSELFNTGSSYCYDGADLLYLLVSFANDFIYIFSLNVGTRQLDGAFQTTTLQGSIHIGNYMEVVTSDDGGKFLFVGVNNSRLMYKTFIY